jgi:alanine racemase
MTFKSTLSQIKSLSKGESVGYNADWQANEDTSYGIIPIGYADGYDFLLSNKGKVLCNA